MRKLLFLFIILFLISPVFARGGEHGYAQKGWTPGLTINEPTKETELQIIQSRNSILNVQQGIQSNQRAMNNRFKQNIPPQKPNNHHAEYPHKDSLHPHKPHFNPNGQRPYPLATPRPGFNPNAYVPHVYGFRQYTSGLTLEDERKELMSKYSSILSDKTADNGTVCSKIASFYKYESKEELSRILNTVLKLNCDISKLRP